MNTHAVPELAGCRFGQLSVIHQAGRNPNGHVIWQCACDCGRMTKAITGHLIYGDRTSCGCANGRGLPMAERFALRVDKDGPVHPELGTRCWLWKASTNKAGYGTISDDNGRGYLAHRVSLQLAGTDPKGWYALHKCDNKACVNPEHLYLGNDTDNKKDARDRKAGLYKITREIAAEIRATVPSQITIHDAAKKYGVHPSSIHNILAGKTRVDGESGKAKRRRIKLELLSTLSDIVHRAENDTDAEQFRTWVREYARNALENHR